MSTLPVLGYLTSATRTEGEQKVAFEDQLASIKQIPGAGVAETTLTIASGSITPPGGGPGIFKVDTEAAAAADDLTNIAQTNFPDGSCIIIRCANAGRVVTIKTSAGGAGQLVMAGSQDVILNDTKQWVELKRTGTLWEELSSSLFYAPTIKAGLVVADPAVPLGVASKQYVDTRFANLILVATVGASALTVAVKTKAGTDPSVNDPIILAFRNATIGTGDYTLITLTAALSLVISSGSTLGTVNAVAHRLYIGLANDAGTPRLFLYNPLDSTLNHLVINNEFIASSTAEGGAGAADSALVLYSGTAFTNKAISILGYLESSQATAGTWATAPSKIQVMIPGVRKSGEVVQRTRVTSGTVATGTTAVPFDNTIPQITEGDEYLSRTIVPQSAINLLDVKAQACLAQSNAANSLVMALFQDAVANALKATPINGAGANQVFEMALSHRQSAGVTSTITFRVRAGNATGATTTFNGAAGAQLMGGVASSFMHVDEIQV